MWQKKNLGEMASSDLKGFYKQKKKSGVSKPTSKKSGVSGKSSAGVFLGAGTPAQTPALVAHGSVDLHDEYGEEEEKLRQFDMDMRYGPCLGMSRLDRWNRALAMGLRPPPELGALLQAKSQAAVAATATATAAAAAALECLWEGRV